MNFKNLLNIFFILCLFISFSPSLKSEKLSLQHGVIIKKDLIIENYWISEKLDGVRGYWDGEKLLTRNGNEISVPTWFTENWPTIAFEGEIWSKRNDFQRIVSCIKRKKVTIPCWKNLKLKLFDLPHHQGNFTMRINAMKTIVVNTKSPYLHMIHQYKVLTTKALYQQLDKVVEANGEGLMLHHQDSLYRQGRNPQLMKLKKHQDAEALVLKHLNGKGKYQHMLGAILVVMPSGIQFKIGSGFTDKQRKDPPPVGSIITYKYIGKTQRGVPRFASFMRIRK